MIMESARKKHSHFRVLYDQLSDKQKRILKSQFMRQFNLNSDPSYFLKCLNQERMPASWWWFLAVALDVVERKKFEEIKLYLSDEICPRSITEVESMKQYEEELRVQRLADRFNLISGS